MGQQYSWLGSIVYVAQLIWQPVSSYLIIRMPVAKYCQYHFYVLSRYYCSRQIAVFVNVFLWGVVVACTAAANDFRSLLAARFFLGIFEATVGEFIARWDMKLQLTATFQHRASLPLRRW